MLKEAGQGFAAVIDVLLKWAFADAVAYVFVIYGWPRLETFWNERDNAYLAQPKLEATIVQDGKYLAAAKAPCRVSAARASRNGALISSFASRPVRPGQAPGLNASDIAELLQ